jgi:hypothetical protein
MSLAEQLDTIRAGSAKRVPEDQRAVMTAATEALRASGILDRAPGVGEKLPDFALPGTDGNTITSDDLLAQGPLVLTYFRGAW